MYVSESEIKMQASALIFNVSIVLPSVMHNFFFVQMKKIIQITMITVITTPGSITLIVAVLCLKFVVKLLIHSAIKKEK